MPMVKLESLVLVEIGCRSGLALAPFLVGSPVPGAPAVGISLAGHKEKALSDAILEHQGELTKHFAEILTTHNHKLQKALSRAIQASLDILHEKPQFQSLYKDCKNILGAEKTSIDAFFLNSNQQKHSPHAESENIFNNFINNPSETNYAIFAQNLISPLLECTSEKLASQYVSTLYAQIAINFWEQIKEYSAFWQSYIEELFKKLEEFFTKMKYQKRLALRAQSQRRRDALLRVKRWQGNKVNGATSEIVGEQVVRLNPQSPFRKPKKFPKNSGLATKKENLDFQPLSRVSPEEILNAPPISANGDPLPKSNQTSFSVPELGRNSITLQQKWWQEQIDNLEKSNSDQQELRATSPEEALALLTSEENLQDILVFSMEIPQVDQTYPYVPAPHRKSKAKVISKLAQRYEISSELMTTSLEKYSNSLEKRTLEKNLPAIYEKYYEIALIKTLINRKEAALSAALQLISYIPPNNLSTKANALMLALEIAYINEQKDIVRKISLNLLSLYNPSKNYQNWMECSRHVAEIYLAIGLTKEVPPIIEAGIQSAEGLYGKNSPQKLIWLKCKVRLLYSQNRLKELDSLGDDIINLAEKGGLEYRLYKATGYRAKGIALGERELIEEALSFLRKAKEINQEILGENHRAVAMSLNDIAGLLAKLEQYESAEKYYLHAIKIGEQELGAYHPDIAIWLNNLAALFEETSRQKEAEPLYRKSLAIDEYAQGESHTDVAARLHNLAMLLFEMNQKSEAQPLLRRALRILYSKRQESGSTHPFQQDVEVAYVGVLYNAGYSHSEIHANIASLQQENKMPSLPQPNLPL